MAIAIIALWYKFKQKEDIIEPKPEQLMGNSHHIEPASDIASTKNDLNP